MNGIKIKICLNPFKEETKQFAIDRVAVGRDLENEIPIADRDVSRVHCVLVAEGDRWRVRDMGSTNGTFVNGVPVHERPLAPGDIIVVGKCRLHIEACRIGDDLSAAETQELPPALAPIHEVEADADQLIDDLVDFLVEGSADPEQLRRAARLLTGVPVDLAALYDRTALAGTTLEDEFAAPVVRGVADVFSDAEFCALLLVAPATQRLQLRAAAPEDRGEWYINYELCEWALATKKALVAEVEEETAPAIALCAPLLAGGRGVGCLYLVHTGEKERFDEFELRLLALYALRLAAAVNNCRAFVDDKKRYNQLLAVLDRTPLIQREIMDRRRHQQLNTVAGASVAELGKLLTEAAQLGSSVSEEIPAAHAARKDLDRLEQTLDETRRRLANLEAYCRRGKAHIHSFQPTEIIDQIADLVRDLLSGGVWLEVDQQEELPEIEFDPVLFEQILLDTIMIGQQSMLEGGRLKLLARRFVIDKALAERLPALRPGVGLHLILQTSGGLPLNELDGGDAEATLRSADRESLTRMHEIMKANHAALDIEPQSNGTRLHLYFPQTAIEPATHHTPLADTKRR